MTGATESLRPFVHGNRTVGARAWLEPGAPMSTRAALALARRPLANRALAIHAEDEREEWRDNVPKESLGQGHWHAW